MDLNSETRLSAGGIGRFASITCETTSTRGAAVTVTVMAPPPGQIEPALHCTQGPTSVVSLMYPGLQVHASWFVDPDDEKLCKGH